MALLPLALSGCTQQSSTPNPGPSDPDDVETGPWDGSAQTLPERTDAIGQTAYSDCHYKLPPNTQVTACDDPSLFFDRSSCPSDAFNSLDSTGTYQIVTRTVSGLTYASFGLRIPSDGTPSTLFDGGRDVAFLGGIPQKEGTPLTQQQVGAGSFSFSMTFPWNPPRDFARSYLFAGCTRPEPDRINGCFALCSNGGIRSVGTFTAVRTHWGRGEAESGGGLTLVSETAAPLPQSGEVTVAKNHAYVVGLPTNNYSGGLAVFDVSDRAHPVLVKSLPFGNATPTYAVAARGDALYVGGFGRYGGGFLVYDISNPADPQPVGVQSSVGSLFVDGDRLYTTGGQGADVQVYDISTPLAPVLLQRVTPLVEGTTGPLGVSAWQGRLYVNHGVGGFLAFDVSNPTSFRQLGGYNFVNQYSNASVVGTFAGRTIAFEAGQGLNAHLRVLDVTDPNQMRLIGEHTLRSEFSINHLVLKGTRLYTTWFQEGVRVLDVSIPTQPHEVAFFNTYRETDTGRKGRTLEGASGIHVPGDGYVYVADTHRGLLIFNEP
ncbi:LVIVD repeat-containing protein [Corallococcus terminator]|uniref:LVIVD repeat-containing protein n=1 Tax=Corallococcus terminator TaxID=2316733 RepID=UPI0013150C79|nr:hypothetical protein [Corallococcus terminator]